MEPRKNPWNWGVTYNFDNFGWNMDPKEAKLVTEAARMLYEKMTNDAAEADVTNAELKRLDALEPAVQASNCAEANAMLAKLFNR